MSTEGLDPARLAELRALILNPYHCYDGVHRELLDIADRLAEAVRRVEALANQESEAVASGFARLFNGELPMAFVSVPSLRAALAGDTERAGQ